jgi:hypothetical protein
LRFDTAGISHNKNCGRFVPFLLFNKAKACPFGRFVGASGNVEPRQRLLRPGQKRFRSARIFRFKKIGNARSNTPVILDIVGNLLRVMMINPRRVLDGCLAPL